MKNKILGTIGVIWGGLIILNSLLGGISGGGSYLAGQIFALILGGLLFGFGLKALMKKKIVESEKAIDENADNLNS